MLGDFEEAERRDARLIVVAELDLDVAVGGDLANGGLVVVAVLVPQSLALLADLPVLHRREFLVEFPLCSRPRRRRRSCKLKWR